MKVMTQCARDISPSEQKLHVAAENKLILLMEYLTLTKIPSQLEVKKRLAIFEKLAISRGTH